MDLKNRQHQKACVNPMLNPYSKFQLPTSILRIVMQGTNPKNEKNDKKTKFLGSCRDAMRLKSQNPSESTSWTHTNLIFLI